MFLLIQRTLIRCKDSESVVTFSVFFIGLSGNSFRTFPDTVFLKVFPHYRADRLLSDEVFINYLASAGGSEVTLEPAISLLSVLLKWTWCCPRLCTGDEGKVYFELSKEMILSWSVKQRRN